MASINILWLVLAFFGAYFLGSIPFSVWIGKLATGKDLREYNIGNPGGFNAMITYGPIIGLTITFLDQLKGIISIAVIDHVFSMDYFEAPDGSNVWHIIACIFGPVCCMLGHNFSFWLKFKGGRGTGVMMGTMLYYQPLLLLSYLFIFAIFSQALKMNSRLSNIIVGFFYVPIAFFIPISPPWANILTSWVAGATGYAFITQGLVALAMWLVIIPFHWSGVVNALKGTEWSFSVKDGQKISESYDTKVE